MPVAGSTFSRYSFGRPLLSTRNFDTTPFHPREGDCHTQSVGATSGRPVAIACRTASESNPPAARLQTTTTTGSADPGGRAAATSTSTWLSSAEDIAAPGPITATPRPDVSWCPTTIAADGDTSKDSGSDNPPGPNAAAPITTCSGPDRNTSAPLRTNDGVDRKSTRLN